MLRRTFLIRITCNVASRPTPNPDCLQFRPIAPLDGVLPPHCPPCEVPYKSVAKVHPLAELLYEHYEREVRSVFLAEEYVAVTKWADVRWSIELERSICGLIGSFLMTNDCVPPDDSEMKDVDRDVGLAIDSEKDSEILQCIKELLTKEVRPMVQRDGGDIKLMEWVEEVGVVKLKMLGACRSCPSSKNTLKEGIERMLQHFLPEVKEVVEFKTQQDSALDAISKQRVAAAAQENEKKRKNMNTKLNDERGQEGRLEAEDDERDPNKRTEHDSRTDPSDQPQSHPQPIALSLNPQTITATASWNIKDEIQKQLEALKDQKVNPETVVRQRDFDLDRSRGFISTPGGASNSGTHHQYSTQATLKVDPLAALNALGGLSADDVAASLQRQEVIEKKLEQEAKENAERWAKARAQQRRKQKKMSGMMDDPEG